MKTRAERIAADVLTTAVEGGIGYWARVEGIERDASYRVRAVTVRDWHARDGEPNTWRLTPLEVERAIRRVAAPDFNSGEWLKRAARRLGEGDDEDDAGLADVIVQAACF